MLSRGESSLAAYLSLAHKTDAISDVPDYVRKVKVAFLSNFTIQGLPEVFKAQALFHNLLVSTYLGPYNQHAQEILNNESGLYKFEPKLVYLIVDETNAEETLGLAERLTKESGLPAGQAGATVITGGLGLNSKFDFNEFLESIGREKYWNTKYKELGDLRLAPTAFPLLANVLMGYAVAVSGTTKKCLVLDLDNTLWRGIVGEDGPDKIVPDQTLQERIRGLYEKGIVLAINSKNNPEDALAVIEQNPEMRLRKEHFAAWRINWEPKSANMAALAEELNLGLDTFVFLDDQAFERAQVKQALPEITVLAPEELAGYQGFFAITITDEDRKRGRTYVEERQRREVQTVARSLDDFLRELKLETTISKAGKDAVSRVSQLTQRTNQFNLTTRRYSETDVAERIEKGWPVLTIEAKDRFGEYGIIGAAMIEPAGEAWRVDTFLMSCRILGRGIEKALLAFIANEAAAAGAKRLKGEFIPTAKNKPAEEFWPENGFKEVGQESGMQVYEYDLKKKMEYPRHVKVIAN